MTSESRTQQMFAGLPRRKWIGGVVSGALALLICGAFLTDAVPTRSSEDWLYDLEARRDQLARAFQARERAAHQTEPRARVAPGQKPRAAALASTAAPVIDHQPPPAARHARCQQAAQ